MEKNKTKEKTNSFRPAEQFNPGVFSYLQLNFDFAEWYGDNPRLFTTPQCEQFTLKGERERERGRLLTAQSGFLMKMEDKCLFSLTVPRGRVIVIIPKSKQGS